MAAKRKTPRKESDIRRKVGIRPVKKSFLIVCEGLNTEPEYFNSFRLTSANVKAVGKGLGTRTLVREAVSIRQEEQCKGKIYDYYWVVFDKDDFPENDFNTAIKEAEAEDFSVAWSNQAFEFWFILHFILYHGPLHRNQYSEMLTKLTGMPYSKKPVLLQRYIISCSPNWIMQSIMQKASFKTSRGRLQPRANLPPLYSSWRDC